MIFLGKSVLRPQHYSGLGKELIFVRIIPLISPARPSVAILM